jgi:hypothetical protein
MEVIQSALCARVRELAGQLASATKQLDEHRAGLCPAGEVKI